MLPEIPLSEIQEMAKHEDPMDFLFVFISPYITLEQQKADLSESQRSLLAFNDMFREIYNGGFIQLIINGCGKNVFCSSFVKDLEKWGAHNIAAIVKRGKALYDTHKEEIEGATDISDEAFDELYEKYPEFDDLDQDYYDFMDDTEDSENIKQYILEHLDEFAEIKN
jgi:hypothetical protein